MEEFAGWEENDISVRRLTSATDSRYDNDGGYLSERVFSNNSLYDVVKHHMSSLKWNQLHRKFA